LGQGIANLINIFNPEKIVFGGSISFQKSFLEQALKISEISVFDKKAFPEWSISELKEEMNVLGVCALYYV
jgi:predicted NBD/HSP70 family sugar kinase